MKQLAPDLWQTTVGGYGGGVFTNAYLLTRPQGNLLLYSVGSDEDFDQIDELGGVSAQLLSHRDEAGPMLDQIRNRFGSRLACSALERSAVSEAAAVDVIFEADDDRFEDVEIMHAPGHTDGSVCFRYASPHGQTYLFTGDTIFRWEDHWGTFVFAEAGGSAEDLTASLARLRDWSPAPDWVISSACFKSVGAVELDGAEWAEIVNEQIAALS